MKQVTFLGSRAALVAVALSLAPAYGGFAQDEGRRDVVLPIKDSDVVQKVASGNITNVTPGEIFIKGPGDAHPTGYNLTVNTTFVDEQDAPAQKANAKVGRAVVITYVMQGEDHIAMKVVVRNAP